MVVFTPAGGPVGAGEGKRCGGGGGVCHMSYV